MQNKILNNNTHQVFVHFKFLWVSCLTKQMLGLLLRLCTLQCCFMLYFLCLLILVDSHHIHDSVLPFTHFIFLWSVGRRYLSLNPVKLIKFRKNTSSHTMVLTPSCFVIFCCLFKHLESFGFLSKNTRRFSSLFNHKCRILPFSTI